MSDKSYAQIAFEAYSESMNGKTFDGRPIPKWDELGESVQAAWRAAAQAVEDAWWDAYNDDLSIR